MDIAVLLRGSFVEDPNLSKLICKLFLQYLESIGFNQKKKMVMSTVKFNLDKVKLDVSHIQFEPSNRTVYQEFLDYILSLSQDNVKWSAFVTRVIDHPEKALGDVFLGPLRPENIDLITPAKTNTFIAEKIRAVAALKKRNGDETSSIAHTKGAASIASHPTQIRCKPKPKEIKFVGPSIADKIEEILDTGTLAILDQKTEEERVVEEFCTIWGVGDVKAREWYAAGHRSIQEIKVLASSNAIHLTNAQKLCLGCYEDLLQKLPHDDMLAIKQLLDVTMQKNWPDMMCEIMGSFRRGKRSSKDIDILIYPKENCVLVNNILRKLSVELAKVVEIQTLALGQKKYESIIKFNGVWRRLDVFVSERDGLGCALCAHTGPAALNRKMRDNAKQKGWTLNETYLYDENGDVIPTPTEQSVFAALNEPYREPKDRV